MSTPSPGPRVPLLAAALALVLTACAGTATSDDATGLPTAEDLGVAADEQPIDPVEEPVDGAAGSCLAGDPDCTDESFGGQDVARPVPLSSEPSGAEPAARGAARDATGHQVEHAYLVNDDTLQLTVGDTPCMVIQDVMVQEADDAVRVLVLAGQDAGTDTCIESYVQFAVGVDLTAPLGDRALLDLAG